MLSNCDAHVKKVLMTLGVLWHRPMARIGRVQLRCRKKLEHNCCNMKWELDRNDFNLRRRSQNGFDDA